MRDEVVVRGWRVRLLRFVVDRREGVRAPGARTVERDRDWDWD